MNVMPTDVVKKIILHQFCGKKKSWSTTLINFKKIRKKYGLLDLVRCKI